MVLALLLPLVGCAVPGSEATPTETREAPEFTPTAQAAGPGVLAQSGESRVTSPAVSPDELGTRVEGTNALAFDLYQAVREEGENVFYSPYSIALTLAMAYAGARGQTAHQMADKVHYTLSHERVHPAFNALALMLASRGAETGEDAEKRFRLIVANAVWGQSGYDFREAYLDVLARNYGTGLRLLDFEAAPEEARQAINAWVSDRTNGLIEDLIPEGVINTMTQLVLTNAVYFRAAWKYSFDDANTTDDSFYVLDGEEVPALIMEQTEEFGYAEGEGYQAVELPYVGDDVSMVIVAPERAAFEAFE
jgi:serpin B